MAALVWDQTGKKYYETGVDKGVYYPLEASGAYGTGEAWDGLMSVEESPSGAEPSAIYANNHKYLELMSEEEFAGTIGAYTYPAGFNACQGIAEMKENTGVYVTQQVRKHFGFSYRTLVGNDTELDDHGYKLHLVYNALAKPSSQTNNSKNDSAEAKELSWEFSTTPVEVGVDKLKPTAHIVIDSRVIDAGKLKKIEDLIYGTEQKEATLPSPKEIYSIIVAEG